MSVVKRPTSSLTATELLVNRLWYRGKVKIEQLLKGTPETFIPQSSGPIANLPQELIEVIISYFIYDVHTLLACSMTCNSWYTAAVPHLHHSLTTDRTYCSPKLSAKYLWPVPLQNSYHLGLLPLVKRFRFRTGTFPPEGFTPKRLDNRTFRYFSALKNLQELGIDALQVSSFMPDIRRYFGHFAPTLRLLALGEPNGSSREILYFIGLFPYLQDLKICYYLPVKREESVADPKLVPLFVPPLRGRLILRCFTRGRLVEEMITFFGGLRFCYMDLLRVTCVQLLLDACSETLETFRVYPIDDFGGKAMRWHPDLSRNKSLRTLEITIGSIAGAGNAASKFLKTVLSTIASPLPLEVIIIYTELDFGYSVRLKEGLVYVYPYPHFEGSPRSLACSPELFGVFSEMCKVREIRLVFCADVLERIAEYAMGELKRYVELGRRRGGLEYLQEAPLIMTEMRTLRSRPGTGDTGRGYGGGGVSPSAL